MKRVGAIALSCLLVACLPTRGTFHATTRGAGIAPESDPAAYSRAKIRRVGRIVTVQDAYSFDLGRLVDLDADGQVHEDTDEASLTRNEAIVTCAIHAAFGLGLFDAVLDQLKGAWAQGVMRQTRVGKPFFVRSLSPKRSSYYLVPVLYKQHWAVASHVGRTPAGRYYSDGFTVPDMPLETPAASTVYGQANLRRMVASRWHLPDPRFERVFVERVPPPDDALLGYCWRVQSGDQVLLVTPQGRARTLTAAEASLSLSTGGLDHPLDFSSDASP